MKRKREEERKIRRKERGKNNKRKINVRKVMVQGG